MSTLPLTTFGLCLVGNAGIITANINLSPHAVIEFRDCLKAYGEVQAVHSISLQIPGAKTTVLIGPSGCGKSTLLRLVIGLIRPDSGHLYFEGNEVLPDVVLAAEEDGLCDSGGRIVPASERGR